jgi:hypothetical protein
MLVVEAARRVGIFRFCRSRREDWPALSDLLVGRWVLDVLFPPFRRSRAEQTSWLGRSDQTSLQWEVSLIPVKLYLI